MGYQAKFLESGQSSDYETNIDVLATPGYNVTSLMFAEDQVGFLAGGMPKSGFVCPVSSMLTPQSERFQSRQRSIKIRWFKKPENGTAFLKLGRADILLQRIFG